jgi:hypothetical protein
MSREKPEEIATPTPAEIECVATLWTKQVEVESQGLPASAAAMKLSSVRNAIIEGRRREGDHSEPALTTVSTNLRSCAYKGFIKEVRLSLQGEVTDLFMGGMRGAFGARSSPQTAYLAAKTPGELLEPAFKALARAYPESQRQLTALIDFAKVLSLPPEIVEDLQKWMTKRLAKGTAKKENPKPHEAR